MNSVLFMDQIEDLYLLSGKEGVVIYFLMEGSYVTQYLMLIMLVIKAWYVTKQYVFYLIRILMVYSAFGIPKGLFLLALFPVIIRVLREREREREI